MILLKLLRIRQWIKSSFVIAPIFFARQFDSLPAWGMSLSAALAFALTASVVYIFNDMIDRKEDQHHPVKSMRPLASGQVTIVAASAIAVICILLAGGLLRQLNWECTAVIFVYLISNIFYTWKLKHVALLDVFFIASCFVMRVFMGCFALSVMVSPWIILTTFMLALFLGFGKRYHELGIAEYASYKANLRGYNRDFLDKLVMLCGASSLVCYAIYAVEIAHAERMIYTVPFVAFGLFRYLQSIYVYGQGGEPENVILHDRLQWLNMGLWLLCALWALD